MADIDEFISGPFMTDVHENGLGEINNGPSSYSDDAMEISDSSISIEYMSNGVYDCYSAELTKNNCPNVAKWLKEHYKVDVLK